MKKSTTIIYCLAIAILSSTSFAQQQSPESMLATQREKLAAFARMNGVWRGESWVILPSGEKNVIVHTERVGSMLEGAVKVIEGRGYDKEGKVVFNAFASMAYDEGKKAITMQSYAQGRVGNYVVTPTEKGFTWEIPAGPTTIRYVAEISHEKWFEYGERIVQGRDPFRFIEMTLTRVGDTDWPSADPVPMLEAKEGRTKQ